MSTEEQLIKNEVVPFKNDKHRYRHTEICSTMEVFRIYISLRHRAVARHISPSTPPHNTYLHEPCPKQKQAAPNWSGLSINKNDQIKL
jgi:hypothetical protein